MPKYLDDTGLATNIQIAKDTFMPKMTVDSSPTANSTNLVTSGGVKTAVDAKQDTISDLATIRSGSQNNVKYTSQSLSASEKAQARANIGAGTGGELRMVSTLSAMPQPFSTPKTGGDMATYLGLTTLQLDHLFTGDYSYLTFSGMESYSITYSNNGFDVLLGGDKWAYLISIDDNELYTLSLVGEKQDKLVSGTNIKTINNESLLGSGNITIEGGSSVQSDWEEADTTDPSYIQNKPDDLVHYDYVGSTPQVTVPTFEIADNKVTSLSPSSTNTQYPSAKCVYDAIQAGGGGASVSGKVLYLTSASVTGKVLNL